MKGGIYLHVPVERQSKASRDRSGRKVQHMLRERYHALAHIRPCFVRSSKHRKGQRRGRTGALKVHQGIFKSFKSLIFMSAHTQTLGTSLLNILPETTSTLYISRIKRRSYCQNILFPPQSSSPIHIAHVRRSRCSTPKRCSSSTTARPRSRKAVDALVSTACVATRMSTCITCSALILMITQLS